MLEKPASRRSKEDAALVRARRLADLMDRRYRIPRTNIRFGLDPIIGLLPVVGDTVSALISAYPIVEAVRLKIRKRTILRMGLNLGIDWVIGLVPLLDLVLDVAFKANVKNSRLLESEFGRLAPAAPQDRPKPPTSPIVSDTSAPLRPSSGPETTPMESTLWNILIWGSRCLAGAVLIATLLPFVRSGSWMIRAWDFPRLQLTAMCLITVLTLLACTARFGWRPDIWGLMIALGLAATWQVSHVAPYTTFWPKRLADTDSADLTLLIANLDVRNPRAADAAEAIAGLEFDAVLLIEIDSEWARTLAPVRSRFAHHVEEIRPEGLSMALWSNVPVEQPEIRYIASDQRPSIHTEMVLSPTKRARFIGLHPVPPGLPTNGGGDRHDSRIRDAELIKVAEFVGDDTQREWIIAGDFNDVAWSHTTRLFEKLSGLADPRVGRGMLNTYHAGRPLLRYPLDHLFVSPSFEVADLQRIRIPGSDHFGILVGLRFTHGPGADPDADPGDHEEAAEMIEEGVEDAEDSDEGAPDAEQDQRQDPGGG